VAVVTTEVVESSTGYFGLVVDGLAGTPVAPKSILHSSAIPLGLRPAAAGGALPVVKTLKFVMQKQLQTQWCWAAVTSSVATYFKNLGWSQCKLANDQMQLNKPPEGTGPPLVGTPCCSQGSSQLCNRPWYLDKALTRTRNFGAMSQGALTLAKVKSEIGAGRPIGVRIGWPGTSSGHFVAIGGYAEPNILHVRDPWFGDSNQPYETFKSSYQGARWTHSYTVTPTGGSYAAPSSYPPSWGV